MPFIIDSLHDSKRNLVSRLVFDFPGGDTPPTVAFQYLDGGQDSPVRPLFEARIDRLFEIRFARYKLATNTMFGGYIEYAPAARSIPRVLEYKKEERLVLLYKDVVGHLKAPEPKHFPEHPELQTIGTMDLTVTISTSAAESERGWIDFDIQHSYPNPPVPARSDAFAVEETLRFPVFDVSGAGKNFEPAIVDPTLQFSALYVKTNFAAPTFNVANGVAMHVQNERGHRTFAEFGDDKKLVQVLRNSMHFKSGAFVRAPQYALSHDEPFGFGGNGLHYRVRTFHEKSAIAGGPVDWYDVLNLYRDWLGARYSAPGTQYQKFRPDRPNTAPADGMFPHTTILNWGLDGAVDVGSAHQSILELHPALAAFAGDGRLSLSQLARKLRERYAPSDRKIEVQTWGIERAGFYQFLCGYPHLADVVHGSGTFAMAVAELTAAGAATTVTTDPVRPIFDRKRFAGHIRWKGGPWDAAALDEPTNYEVLIKDPFPQALNRPCVKTQGRIGAIGEKFFNRVWLVDLPDRPEQDHVRRFNAAQTMAEFNNKITEPPNALGSGMYRAIGKQICPTADVAQLYVNEWVAPHLFAKGVRLVEFMKAGRNAYFCFDRNHAHIVPALPATSAYDNVIGFGSWYVERLRAIFKTLQQRGAQFDAEPVPFRLAHEFAPPEQLVAFVDQAYSTSDEFNYVYSHLVTPMITPGRGGAGLPPGYREQRRGSNVVLCDFMRSEARDSDPRLEQWKVPMTEAEEALLIEARRPSFEAWRNESIKYFRDHFTVADFGLAPIAYPTGPAVGPLKPWNPADPMATTNPPTYTYNRTVQQTFNMRANIFATAEAAVRGQRIMIPAHWMEGVNDCDLLALDHAVAAARLHIQQAQFFRFGRMLGETLIETVNGTPMKKLCAWVAGARSFLDVKALDGFIKADNLELGAEWEMRGLKDFYSFCWDKQTRETDVVIAHRIVHRVWERTSAGVRRVLYAFANLGNSEADVRFYYGRGLEGRSSWKRTIRIIDGSTSGPATVSLGAREDALRIPARGFAAVVVEP